MTTLKRINLNEVRNLWDKFKPGQQIYGGWDDSCKQCCLFVAIAKKENILFAEMFHNYFDPDYQSGAMWAWDGCKKEEITDYENLKNNITFNLGYADGLAALKLCADLFPEDSPPIIPE